MLLTLEQRREIGGLAFGNPNITLLSKKYHCTRACIKRWLAEGKKSTPNYSVAAGRGRKQTLSAAERTRVRRQALNKNSGVVITRRINTTRNDPVSRSTIVRCIHASRFPVGWGKTASTRKLSHANKLLRHSFASAHQQDNVNHWVFLDAKYLYLYIKDGKYVHRCWQRLDKPPPHAGKGAPTVFLFYGAVARGHKSKLYFVAPTPAPGSTAKRGKESFASKHYIGMLEALKHEITQWYPRNDYAFIRDHATQHLSAESTAAVTRLGLRFHPEFPAQSWDINIIENVWGVLDDKLLGRAPRTNDGWRRAIKEAWGEVEQSTIDKLVCAVPDRMHMVVENGGGWPP